MRSKTAETRACPKLKKKVKLLVRNFVTRAFIHHNWVTEMPSGHKKSKSFGPLSDEPFSLYSRKLLTKMHEILIQCPKFLVL